MFVRVCQGFSRPFIGCKVCTQNLHKYTPSSTAALQPIIQHVLWDFFNGNRTARLRHGERKSST